jgi:hypothetical protein
MHIQKQNYLKWCFLLLSYLDGEVKNSQVLEKSGLNCFCNATHIKTISICDSSTAVTASSQEIEVMRHGHSHGMLTVIFGATRIRGLVS